MIFVQGAAVHRKVVHGQFYSRRYSQVRSLLKSGQCFKGQKGVLKVPLKYLEHTLNPITKLTPAEAGLSLSLSPSDLLIVVTPNRNSCNIYR